MKIGNSQVDQTVVVYGDGPVVIGDRSRIDAGVVITAGPRGVYIGDNVHIARGCILAGGSGQIVFEDFSCSGADSKFFTASEDAFWGMTNPTIPEEFRRPKTGDIHIGRHALIYANVIICPGARIGDGAGVGAFTIVKSDIQSEEMVVGIPTRSIGKRNLSQMVDLEKQYLYSLKHGPVARLMEWNG